MAYETSFRTRRSKNLERIYAGGSKVTRLKGHYPAEEVAITDIGSEFTNEGTRTVGNERLWGKTSLCLWSAL